MEREEAVERLVVCVCKSEVPVAGWEQGRGSSKPNAIVWSCVTCICLPVENRDPGGCGVVTHVTGWAGLPTSFLPSPLLSASHKVALK